MSQQSQVKTYLYAALVLLLVLQGIRFISCKQTGGPRLIPVAGKVLVDGKPCSGAMVVFVPADLVGVAPGISGAKAASAWPDGYPRAIADADGNFQAFTRSINDGAPAGKYMLTIVWPPAPPPEDPDGENDPPPLDFHNQDQLGGLYKDPAKNNIEVIVEGKNVVVPTIQLSTAATQ